MPTRNQRLRPEAVHVPHKKCACKFRECHISGLTACKSLQTSRGRVFAKWIRNASHIGPVFTGSAFRDHFSGYPAHMPDSDEVPIADAVEQQQEAVAPMPDDEAPAQPTSMYRWRRPTPTGRSNWKRSSTIPRSGRKTDSRSTFDSFLHGSKAALEHLPDGGAMNIASINALSDRRHAQRWAGALLVDTTSINRIADQRGRDSDRRRAPRSAAAVHKVFSRPARRFKTGQRLTLRRLGNPLTAQGDLLSQPQ